MGSFLESVLVLRQKPSTHTRTRLPSSSTSAQLYLHTHTASSPVPRDWDCRPTLHCRGNTTVASNPCTRLLQGFQGTALTLHMQLGGGVCVCRAPHLFTLSQASISSSPKNLSPEFPPHFPPGQWRHSLHSPQASHPALKPLPKPYACTWGAHHAAFLPYFMAPFCSSTLQSPSLAPSSPPNTPSHLPQHLYPLHNQPTYPQHHLPHPKPFCLPTHPLL